MRVPLQLASLALLVAGCATTASRDVAADASRAFPQGGRQLSFGVGPRTFEDDGFGRLDDHVAFTLDYCEPLGLERLRLEGGLAYSYDEADGTAGGQDVRLDAETYELGLGVNYSLALGRLRPYAGIGASILFMDVEGIDEDLDLAFDDDDAAVGGYVKAGLLFQVTPTAHVGVELRHFEGGDVSFDQTELGSSYDQILFVLGTSFVTADPYPPHPLRDANEPQR